MVSATDADWSREAPRKFWDPIGDTTIVVKDVEAGITSTNIRAKVIGFNQNRDNNDD